MKLFILIMMLSTVAKSQEFKLKSITEYAADISVSKINKIDPKFKKVGGSYIIIDTQKFKPKNNNLSLSEEKIIFHLNNVKVEFSKDQLNLIKQGKPIKYKNYLISVYTNSNDNEITVLVQSGIGGFQTLIKTLVYSLVKSEEP